MAYQNFATISTNSTRWAVIKTLRASGHATVSELADRVGVKAVTLRHHLTSLQADGLVNVEEQRQGVGRPAHVFSLTRKAERLFPHSYHLLIDRLLDQMKEELAPATVRRLIDALAESLAEDVRREMTGLPAGERRERLIDVLEDKGLSASWQEGDDGLQLIKYHCPYYAVGEQHPELCRIDEELVRAVVEADVERIACLLQGDEACTLKLGTRFPLTNPQDQVGNVS